MQLDPLMTVFSALLQALQTEGEVHEVHPGRVELQVLQIPDTRTYPVMQVQLLPLRVMNCDWSHMVQVVEFVQVRQPSSKLPQLAHCELTRV